ncbi:MAG: segregation/condensation protein A, partial [Christensenellaceae bacterium]|nr:segregation/condensation protein A [Christensenellaceae bacterium]
ELTEENAEELYLNADTVFLAEVFAKLMSRFHAPEHRPREVVYEKDHYSVKEQIRLILARLTIQPEMSFRELLSEKPSSDEVAVTFLSMLQLMNKNKVNVLQDEIFGEITVQRKKENKGE